MPGLRDCGDDKDSLLRVSSFRCFISRRLVDFGYSYRDFVIDLCLLFRRAQFVGFAEGSSGSLIAQDVISGDYFVLELEIRVVGRLPIGFELDDVFLFVSLNEFLHPRFNLRQGDWFLIEHEFIIFCYSENHDMPAVNHLLFFLCFVDGWKLVRQSFVDIHRGCNQKQYQQHE